MTVLAMRFAILTVVLVSVWTRGGTSQRCINRLTALVAKPDCILWGVAVMRRAVDRPYGL